MTRTLAISFLLVAAAGADAQVRRKASVVITAPADGAVLATPVTDVDVAFSSGAEKKNDNERVAAIDLMINGQTVATFDVPEPLREGTHRFSAVALTPFLQPGLPVTIVARGQLGDKGNKHEDSAPVHVTVQAGGDTVAPLIGGLLPAPGSFTSNARPAISAQINDTGGSGLDPAAIILKLDGAAVAATVTPNGADAAGVAFTPLADLAEGAHTFTVDAKDLAGNAAAQASSSFSVDRTAPVVSISAPAAGFTNNPRPPLAATVVDGGAGTAPAAVLVTLDGASILATVTVVNASTLSVAFTPPAPLGEGAHTYEVQATDRVGNASAAQRTVTIDVTPPLVVITAPVTGSTTSDPRPPLSATLSDPSGSGIDPASVKVRLDGVAVAAVVTPTSASFVPGANLTPGSHTYAVEAKDLAGNGPTVATTTFAVSIETLNVTQSTIPDGGFVSTATPSFAATLTNPQGTGINPGSLSVRVDGTLVPATILVVDANTVTLSFTLTTPLGAGGHTITIDGTTTGGAPFATVMSGFGVDLLPPGFGTVTPLEGAIVGIPNPGIAANITDSGGSGVDLSGLTMTVNGVVVPATVTSSDPNAATLSYTPPGLPDGLIGVLFEARDRAGNLTTHSLSFLVDATSPGVVIDAPTGTIPSTSASLHLTLSDLGSGLNLSTLAVTLNGQNVTGQLTQTVTSTTASGAPAGLTVTGTLTALDGANTLSVFVQDNAQHPGSATGSFSTSTTVPSFDVSPFPAFIVDVEKVSAQPLIQEDVPPEQGVDAQAWTSRPILVKVRLTCQGGPVEGVAIKPQLTSGDGSFFHTPQYPRKSGSDGIAGFGFLCPRKPGYSDLSVAVDLPQTGATVTYRFKANLVDAHLILVGDFPGSGIYASVSAPTGIGRTAVVVDEVDSTGAVITQTSSQKMTNFSTTYHTNQNGILHIPLLLKDGATGIARLRVSYPEFADSTGKVLSQVDTFNIDAFVNSGAIRSVRINSGNGQVLFPGKELDQPIVVTPLIPTDSQHPLKMVSVSIVQNETQVGPDHPGTVEPIDGTLVVNESDPAKKSFTAIVTNPNGTLTFKYSADESGTGATLVIEGGVRSSGGAAVATPGDRVVIREPEIRLVTDTQEHLSANPPFMLDELLAGPAPTSAVVHYEVRMPRSRVGSDTLSLELTALRHDNSTVSDDGTWPPPQKTVALTMSDPDVYVSGPVFITAERRGLESVPTGGPAVVFGGDFLQALVNLQAPARPQQQRQRLQTSFTSNPPLPDKEAFSIALVNGRVNIVDSTPRARLTIKLTPAIPPQAVPGTPVTIVGRLDPAAGGSMGQFFVNGAASGNSFSTDAAQLTSLQYEFDPATIPAGSNGVEGRLQFGIFQQWKNNRMDVDLKVRFSKANPVIIGYYYLQTDATDTPFLGRNGALFAGEIQKRHQFAQKIWEQNGIQLKSEFDFGVPVASGMVLNAAPNPIPGDTLDWVSYSPVPPNPNPPPSSEVYLKNLMTNRQNAAPANQKPQVFVFFLDAIAFTKNGVLQPNLAGLVTNVPGPGAIVKPGFALVLKSNLRNQAGLLGPNHAVAAHEIGHIFGLDDLVPGADLQNLMQQGSNTATRLTVDAQGQNGVFLDQFKRSAEAAAALR